MMTFSQLSGMKNGDRQVPPLSRNVPPLSREVPPLIFFDFNDKPYIYLIHPIYHA